MENKILCEKCEEVGIVYYEQADEVAYCSCEYGALKEYTDKTEEMRNYARSISHSYN